MRLIFIIVVATSLMPISAAPAQAAPLDVKGGYYHFIGDEGGDVDVTAQAAVLRNMEALTQYRSIADGSTFPGWQKEWINNLGPGVDRNFVLELNYYGAGEPTIPRPQTVDGVVVPAPDMTIQQRPGDTWKWAYGYRQVTSGQVDPLLKRALDQLKTMPYAETVNIQLGSEFDTDHEFGTTENGIAHGWAASDARALTAVQYIIGYFRSHGLPAGVTFSIGMGGWHRASFRRMHPEWLRGDVQVLQWNAYNHGTPRTPYQVFNRTRAWAIEDLPRWRTKEVVIAEWGTTANVGNQAVWIAGAGAAIKRINTDGRGFRIGTLTYYDNDPNWGELMDRDAGLEALRSVYTARPFIG
ncbi:hypothetical protein [Actinoplanes sp. NPDC049265]|uniref:hypothetical protein n=1 Tax=Actinoplanes sp. NPDC049265 TaxID=3363902 RepID=UPI00371F0B00